MLRVGGPVRSGKMLRVGVKKLRVGALVRAYI